MLRRGVYVLLVALAAAVPASAAPDPGIPPEDTQAVAGRPLLLPRSADVPGRLDAGVAAIAARRRENGTGSALREARRRGLDVSGEAIEVVVTAQPGRTAAVSDLVRSRGGKVVREHGVLVKALVPVAHLEAVGRSAAVQLLAEPLRPKKLATTGQGVAATRASLSLPPGVNGSGVKIAIIDFGFEGLATLQASGDLPAAVTTKSFCDGSAIENGEEHGTAVAEIVHEVAPGAELYLICIDDEVGFGAATDYVIANGIKIVNFSAGYFNSSRGDGSGGAETPDGVVARARAAGVLWINAAGNEARSHWSGSFVDGGGGFNAFGPGDIQIGITVPIGGWACVLLKWDAWPTTATEDFDLGVYDAYGTLVAASVGTQNPDKLPPRETACFSNSGPGTSFGAAIRRSSGTSPRLDLFVDNAAFDEYRTPAGSVLEPASSPGALAVGAICWLGDTLQPYSSQGPTIDGRTKPDLAGFDATSSPIYGASSSCSTGFRGTSAAAPHVAGIAALLMHRNASLTTPGAVQAELEALAVDLGAAGKDSLYGAGKLRAPLPAQNGLIAGSGLTGSDADVYTIDAIGSRTTIAGVDATQETQPSWSGDGGSIVLARSGLGTPFWRVNPDGTSLAALATLPATDSFPTPSPDGTRLAFVRDGDLYVGAADGSGAAQLVPGTLIQHPAWSPDGGTIAFEDAANIYTVAASGGPVNTLFGTASAEAEPAWSPDGTRIALRKHDGSDNEIYVAAANGSSLTPLTANSVDDRHPAWSPDGTKLAFLRPASCCPSGLGDVHVASADGGGSVTQLTFDTITDWVSWQAVVPPSVTSRPTVTGTTAAGSTVAGAAGGWRGTYPLSFAYQWLRCDSAGAGCAAIAGATASTYTATAADAGSTLRLAVTAANAVRSVTATSHFSSTVAGPPPAAGGGGGGGGGGSSGGSADLGIEGYAQPASAAVGEDVTYYLKVSDVNLGIALGVNVDVELPAGVQLVNTYADRGPGCSGSRVLVCNLDWMSSDGPTANVTVRVKVTAAGELALKASVRYQQADPQPGNNALTILVNRTVAQTPSPTKGVSGATPAPTTRTGTAGPNTLRGSARAETLRGLGGNDSLYGLGGNDRLFGGSGNDRLFGGLGRDVLDGGPGNDTISARDKSRDTIRCGPGRDTVTADRTDAVSRDCERVNRR